MLILQRHYGQSIWIGNDIQIIVLGNSKGATRIGIKAPPEMNIVREELRDTKRKRNDEQNNP